LWSRIDRDDTGETRMLRITRQDEPSKVTLQLEGSITAGEIPSLDSAWRSCVSTERSVVIDLAGVRFVDAAGAAVLRALRQGRIEVTGCSPFVRELLGEDVR
jgi:anti-anti-sigma regulatory factor